MQEESRKKEMKLIHECEQLRNQLKGSPKFAQPDVERLQEQLKDTQEMNVKLQMDLESYKVSWMHEHVWRSDSKLEKVSNDLSTPNEGRDFCKFEVALYSVEVPLTFI